MTSDYTVTHGRYEEIVIPGKRLGRQKLRDSRSAAYPFRVRGAHRLALKDVDWKRHAPIFDQGDTASCEGNAEVGCAATSPLWEALGSITRAEPLNEEEALRVYALATSLDGFPGTFTYPPPGGQDTGTDSTSASKAAQQLGLISGYLHAATLDDLLQALQGGPVNVAFDWYEGFDEPLSDGLVNIAGALRGGHALCARGVDTARKRVWFDNSWGLAWGIKGRFCMTWLTLERLLADGGEAVVPVPLSKPAPVPVPVVTDPLAAYLADERLRRWASRRHVLDNGYAARQYTWLREQFPR